MILDSLRSWYFGSYEQEKLDLARDVVARFTRGNVLIQQGHYLDQVAFDQLSKDGDAAIERMQNAVGKA